jgi:hypothetical protein
VSLYPPQLPHRARWLINTLAVLLIAWTVYCIYAWMTESGVWRLTNNLFVTLDHLNGEPMQIALISWAPGLGIALMIGWLALRPPQGTRR